MGRLALLGKLHIAKKELGLDDETYRDVLENLFKVRSAMNLDNFQLGTAIAYFRKCGWSPKRRTTDDGRRTNKKYDDQKGDAYSATPPQKRLIEALWHDVYRGNSETPDLRKFLFNHYKITDLRFATREIAHRCIERLKSFRHRREQDGQAKAEHNQKVA